MFCPHCGKSIDGKARFCDKCGNSVKPLFSDTLSNITKEFKDFAIPTTLIICIISILNTIYTLHFRLTNQEYLGYDVTWDGMAIAETYGIAPELKLPISFVPFTVIALTILLVSFDKTLSTRKKVGLITIGVVFSTLSLLMIWINVQV